MKKPFTNPTPIGPEENETIGLILFCITMAILLLSYILIKY